MPNFTFKVGTLDLSEFVRISEDSAAGLFDQDFLRPSFVDNPLSEGGELSVVDVQLHEKAVPLFLHDSTPALLRTLVRDLNRELRKDVRVEWKPPPGTGDSTYYDLAFGRFEPQHNMRHEQFGWLAGVLRLFVQPFGHTGTSRIVGTAAGTGVAVVVSVPSIAGDAAAHLEALIQVGSQPVTDGRITGVAVVPSYYQPWWPAGSLVVAAGATVSGASGAPGSQALHAFDSSYTADDEKHLGDLILTPASYYRGRNRVLGVAQGYVQDIRAYMDGIEIGAAQATVLGTYMGWHTLDLGVVDIPKHDGRATALIRVTRQFDTGGDESTPDHVEWAFSSRDAFLAGLVLLPEADAQLAVDTERRQLSLDSYYEPTGASPPLGNDLLGNPYASGASGIATYALIRWADQLAGLNVTGYRTGAVTVNHPTAADLKIEIAHKFNDTAGTSLVAAGKIIKAGEGFFARVHQLTGGTYALALLWGGIGGPGFTAPTVLASTALAGGYGDLMRFHSRGNQLHAELRTFEGSLVASLGASHARAPRPGQTVLGIVATSNSGGRIEGHRTSEVPSAARSPRDYARHTASAVTRFDSASAFAGEIDGLHVRGDAPALNPADAEKVVALNLPLDGGPANGLLSAEIRLQERYEFSTL